MSIASVISSVANAADEVLPGAIDTIGARRLAERAKAKALRAEATRNALLFDGLAKTVAELEAECDKLAADHVAKSAPLQAELVRIEQKLLDLCSANRPADSVATDAASRRRQAILLDIEERTQQLETAVRERRVKIDRLNAQKLTLASATTGTGAGCLPSLYDNDLVATASERLQLAYCVACSAAAWASRRCQYAKAGNTWRYPQDLPMRTEAEFAAEYAAAAEALAQAETALAAARQACIDE